MTLSLCKSRVSCCVSLLICVRVLAGARIKCPVSYYQRLEHSDLLECAVIFQITWKFIFHVLPVSGLLAVETTDRFCQCLMVTASSALFTRTTLIRASRDKQKPQ